MGRTYRGPNRELKLSKKGRRRWQPLTGGRKQVVIGRALEADVTSVLETLRVSGAIDSYLYHEPHSEKDQQGIDFTVVRGQSTIEFNVTCSYRAWRKRVVKTGCPTILYFSDEVTADQIAERILELFIPPNVCT